MDSILGQAPETYIYLAFASLSGADKVYVSFKSSVDAYKDTLKMLKIQKDSSVILESEHYKELIRVFSDFLSKYE